jgi:2-polyprenyl-3-methyl-5-hydroxy-6-metoxy-1,4-benzoquinol methylase
MDLMTHCATQLLRMSQYTRFRGLGGYSPEDFRNRGETQPFPQGSRERALFSEFFGFFPDIDFKGSIVGKDLLDFGCGYGGRTIEYARQARSVVGVEPFTRHIDLATAYARSLGVRNVEFRLCTQMEIPLPDASIDVVVSYDVLEHVQSPPASVAEIRRVLRPGGKAFLVFPAYLGAASHHLDYISTLPGLHWIFSARTLVKAVNTMLMQDSRFGKPSYTEPRIAFDGTREVLPSLNGLSGHHVGDLFRAFHIEQFKKHALLRRRKVGAITSWLTAHLPHTLGDMLTASISCVLRKPD